MMSHENTRSSILIHSSAKSGFPVVTGCPFPHDAGEISAAEIVFPDGTAEPVQAAELIPRTANGVRWVELSFLPSRTGAAEVRSLAKGSEDPDLGAETGSGLRLDNALLKVELNHEVSGPPVRIAWGGGSGSLTPDVKTDGRVLREAPDGGRVVRIVRNGPLRCRAEVAGTLVSEDGERFFRYRLAVEIWKGHSALRVDWMLSHETPGVPEMTVERAVLAGTWELGNSVERVFRQLHHTAECLPRLVRNPDPVTILADDLGAAAHVADPAMLLDDSEYPFYAQAAVGAVPPWLQLHGEIGAVCLTVRDFAEGRPNALESAGAALGHCMVPEGNSLPWPQGRRKRESVFMAFASKEADADRLAGIAGGICAEGRAQPTPETLAGAKCFDLDRALLYAPGGDVRMNALLDQCCRLRMPAGKWNLGDTPDTNYTLTYGAGLNGYHPLPGAVPPPKCLSTTKRLFPDVAAAFVEPVWTNNEYDILHALSAEVMRTGQAEHSDTLRRAARHNVEVDFVVFSDDPRHHRASPFHSHFHNTKGAITSHFWTQGLLEYYCLTGDDDALDVALALGDKILEISHSGASANWKFDREIGWALLALVALVDAGFDQFRAEADTMAAFLAEYDRGQFTGRVNLSAGREGRSLERQMIDCGFGYSSMVEAMDRYQRVTGNQNVAAWLDDLLPKLKTELWNKVNDGEFPTIRNMIGLVMAIGFERTGDTAFLDAGELPLEHHLDPAFSGARRIIEADGEVKPCAMIHRGLCRLFGALAREERLRRFEYPSIRRHFGDDFPMPAEGTPR